MTITLGGITLSDLSIEDEFGRKTIDSSMEMALDTTAHVWDQEKKSLNLDLVGGENWGAMTRSTLSSLFALMNVTGATYTLIHNSISKTVKFRTWEDNPIEAVPIAPREQMTDSDYYKNIRIKLLEVNA